MNTDPRQYYTSHLMDSVNQIQLAVIGIGIAILAINYLGLVTVEIDVLFTPPFWQRVILLLLVIAFASYTALVYKAYPIKIHKRRESPIRGSDPVRIFTLFLLDIFQVTLAACMFGVLFVPDAAQLLDSRKCSVGLASQQCLGLPELGIEMIFALGALWHVTVAVWYGLVDGFTERDAGVHSIFALGYVLLVAVSFYFQWFDAWIAAGSFSVVLIALFFVQGRYWLKAWTNIY